MTMPALWPRNICMLQVCCAVRLSILVGPDDDAAMLPPMAAWVVANAASPTAAAALQKVQALRYARGLCFVVTSPTLHFFRL